MANLNNELEYFTALKRIAHYQSAGWLRRNAEKHYGCSYEEALEMAYDNIRGEAANAIHRKRPPKVSYGKPKEQV